MLDASPLANLDDAAKELDRRAVDHMVGLRAFACVERGRVHGETGAFPDKGTRRGAAGHKNREDVAQHVWTGGREQSYRALQRSGPFVERKQVEGIFGVEAVDLPAICDGDIPFEPVGEYRRPHSKHLVNQGGVTIPLRAFDDDDHGVAPCVCKKR